MSAWAGAAIAADEPQYGPAPSWVEPTPIPEKAAAEGAAIQILLADVQSRVRPEGHEFYIEQAFRILTPDGLSAASTLSQVWNPETDTLTVHKIHIIRAGKVSDVLAGGKKLTLLRREENLDQAMLDGRVTATIQPEDVRVGDIINIALTVRRQDPVYQGHFEQMAVLAHPGQAGRVRVRVLWPNATPMRWRTTEGFGTPSIKPNGRGETELLVDVQDVAAPKLPVDAPARYRMLGTLETSDFKSWAEVSSLLAGPYSKATALEPTSPLRAEIAKIKAAHSNPKARAEAALRLVQEDIRYVFLGMNLGGYMPASADLTWSRRFGDCKGKTALLVALLNELGIDAKPVFVSSYAGDGLDERLPMLSAFDHVIVRAEIDGRAYWLDGTRAGDRNLDAIRTPGFHWALPVQAEDAALERLEEEAFESPVFEAIVRLDASAGLDRPAKARVEYLYRYDMAIDINRAFAAAGRADSDRYLREFWRREYAWIEAQEVDLRYDERRQELRITLDGSGVMDWSRNGSARDFGIKESSLGWSATFQREPGPNQDAPYAVGFPDNRRWRVTMVLPDKGAGFRLLTGEDVDTTIANIVYRRRARIENGVVIMEASQRSLGSEFPAAEAASAEKALRALSRYDVNVRFQRISSVSAPSEAYSGVDTETIPVTASDFSVRGATRLHKGDFDGAIADFGRAADLEPKVGKHAYNRGVARYEKGDLAGALQDVDRALALRSDDILALTARGQIHLDRGDDRRAKRDLDEALRIAPGDSRTLMRVGEIYDRSGRFEAAIETYDLWLARYADSERRVETLAMRCVTIGKWGRRLEDGLASCDQALALRPAYSSALAGRGLIRLRQGRPDDALDEFEAALSSRPGEPFVRYARGVAKQRLNRPGALEDLSEAERLEPGLKSEFKAYGFAP